MMDSSNEMTLPTLPRRALAELVGTALLVCTVVGSGIMAERLAGGNMAIALLANSIATGAVLLTLIFTFAGISGAHFNPAVTLAALMERGTNLRTFLAYVPSQIAGGSIGTILANLMFDLPPINWSQRARGGPGQWLAELIATFGLVIVVHGTGKRAAIVPLTVAAYITAAYWFTSSTSFANPAVTLARTMSDTFAGIRAADAPAFIAAQIIGAVLATFLFRWLFADNRVH
jgi:glycerol uptake facilitator-like aquaporin